MFKRFTGLLLVFTIYFFCITEIKGQDSINNFNINIQLNHFIDKYHDSDKYFAPVNPGIEFLYRKSLSNNLDIAVGVNYIFSMWYYNFSPTSKFKRNAHEIAFPVLFENSLQERVNVTFGFYPGWLLKVSEKNFNSSANEWWDITEYIYERSNSKFSCDLYFDLSFKLKPAARMAVLISPFVKYKLKDNLMNDIRTDLYFGVSSKFNFNFKNNKK